MQLTSSNKSQLLLKRCMQVIEGPECNSDVATKVDSNGRYITTPYALCTEIVNEIKNVTDLKSAKILVVDTIEFIPVLLTFGVNTSNITYVAPYELKGQFASALGCNVVKGNLLEWDTDMKFDVVVGNPPYQDKDNLLYPPFFKKSLEIGNIVSMIMPARLESGQVRLKKHNALIKKHLINLSNDISPYFNVNVGEIRNIVASLHVNNNVDDTRDQLDKYVPFFLERNRVSPRRGHGEYSRRENEDENGETCIVSVYRGNRIQYRKIKHEIASKIKSSMITDAPYLVLAQEHPSHGLFNTAIIKNTGIKWGSGVFALEAESEEDARELEQWLISEEIQIEVQKLLKLKGGTHSISGPMFSKLPMHKVCSNRKFKLKKDTNKNGVTYQKDTIFDIIESFDNGRAYNTVVNFNGGKTHVAVYSETNDPGRIFTISEFDVIG